MIKVEYVEAATGLVKVKEFATRGGAAVWMGTVGKAIASKFIAVHGLLESLEPNKAVS